MAPTDDRPQLRARAWVLDGTGALVAKRSHRRGPQRWTLHPACRLQVTFDSVQARNSGLVVKAESAALCEELHGSAVSQEARANRGDGRPGGSCIGGMWLE